MTDRKERGCWLRGRCYMCGHELRFDSTGCPQCGEEFDGRKLPRGFKWPKTCECSRCTAATGDTAMSLLARCQEQAITEALASLAPLREVADDRRPR